MIRTQNIRDWSCFTDACSDAGLPIKGIPEPTSGAFIFEYCRKYNLKFVNRKCQIILEDRPAIVILQSIEPVVHVVFLPSLKNDWQCLADREVKMVIYTS